MVLVSGNNRTSFAAGLVGENMPSPAVTTFYERDPRVAPRGPFILGNHECSGTIPTAGTSSAVIRPILPDE